MNCVTSLKKICFEVVSSQLCADTGDMFAEMLIKYLHCSPIHAVMQGIQFGRRYKIHALCLSVCQVGLLCVCQANSDVSLSGTVVSYGAPRSWGGIGSRGNGAIKTGPFRSRDCMADCGPSELSNVILFAALLTNSLLSAIRFISR